MFSWSSWGFYARVGKVLVEMDVEKRTEERHRKTQV
jgi:hypothetical protein